MNKLKTLKIVKGIQLFTTGIIIGCMIFAGFITSMRIFEVPLTILLIVSFIGFDVVKKRLERELL